MLSAQNDGCNVVSVSCRIRAVAVMAGRPNSPVADGIAHLEGRGGSPGDKGEMESSALASRARPSVHRDRLYRGMARKGSQSKEDVGDAS